MSVWVPDRMGAVWGPYGDRNLYRHVFAPGGDTQHILGIQNCVLKKVDLDPFYFTKDLQRKMLNNREMAKF